MATRIYTNSSGSVGVTPSTWNFANQINPVTVPGTTTKNTGSALTSKTEATGTTSPTARAMGRTIIGPLAAQTISGTVKGQMRGQENNTGANATLALAIKIVQPNGTDRAVLLAQTASDSATAGNELATSLTNAQFKNAAESASITLTSQSATAGDYLVIEWGFRSATTTSRNITLRYGNASATDLAENTTETTDNNPWWEFSANLKWLVEGVGASTPSVATTGVGAALFAGVGSIANTVTVSGDGEATTGTTTVETDGVITMGVTTTGVGAAQVAGVGAGTIALTTTGVGAATAAATGQSSLSVSTSGDSLTVVVSAIDGQSAVSVTTAGASLSVTASSAVASVTVTTSGVSGAVAVIAADATAGMSVDVQAEGEDANTPAVIIEADGSATFTVAVAGYGENAATPAPPPKPSGPAGGMVYWRGDGPVNRGRRSPWERSKTLAPTPRQPKRLEVDQDADDLEVVGILTNWLGRL